MVRNNWLGVGSQIGHHNHLIFNDLASNKQT